MKDSLVTSQIAEPYAQALMAIAKSGDLVDTFSGSVGDLLDTLKSSPELGSVLSSPVVPGASKKAILRQLLNDQIHPYMMNFLLVLVDRGRIAFVEGICKQYQALVRELKQTVLAEVISAVPLSEDQQSAVCAKVQAMTGAQQVELEMTQDADLIGGVVIKVGSQVIDASLRGQLRRIGLKLNTAN
jgi:F-type H+-transporting ATPase subunit delta